VIVLLSEIEWQRPRCLAQRECRGEMAANRLRLDRRNRNETVYRRSVTRAARSSAMARRMPGALVTGAARPPRQSRMPPTMAAVTTMTAIALASCFISSLPHFVIARMLSLDRSSSLLRCREEHVAPPLELAHFIAFRTKAQDESIGRPDCGLHQWQRAAPSRAHRAVRSGSPVGQAPKRARDDQALNERGHALVMAQRPRQQHQHMREPSASAMGRGIGSVSDASKYRPPRYAYGPPARIGIVDSRAQRTEEVGAVGEGAKGGAIGRRDVGRQNRERRGGRRAPAPCRAASGAS